MTEQRSWEAAWKFWLSWEGTEYHSVPGDPGGATRYGIASRYNPGIDLRTLSQDGAAQILRERYWLPNRCDAIASGGLLLTAWSLFDFALLLIVSISSCSKPNLADIVREHVAAVNNDDIEKNLTFFTNDAIFEIGAGTRLSGKDQLRNLMESDATNRARLTILDMKVEGNTVIVRLTGKNEFLRLLGVEESPQRCTYKFRGRFLEKVTVDFPEVGGLFEKKYKLFAEWAGGEHPLEFKKMEAGG